MELLTNLMIQVIRADNVVNLQDHLNDLGSQLELLLLGHESFIDTLVLHVIVTLTHQKNSKINYEIFAVNTDSGVIVLQLSSLSFSNRFDGPETAVVSKSSWDLLESISEGSDGILFDSWNLKKIKIIPNTLTLSAALLTAIPAAISGAPPP